MGCLFLPRCNIAAIEETPAIFLQNLANLFFCCALHSTAQRCHVAICQAADTAKQFHANDSI
jgi:hypothetical protein